MQPVRDEQRTLSACRERYLSNLAALYRRDPSLAARIDALPFSQCPALEPSADGAWTARFAAEGGRPIYLHSRHQPLAEARRLIEAAGPSAAATCLVRGLGLGHVIPAREDAGDRPLLIVFEPRVELIKCAMLLHDLAPLLDDRRLIFVTEAERATLHEKLMPLATDLMLGLQNLVLPAAVRIDADFHARLDPLLKDLLAFIKLQLVTVLKISRASVRNAALNLAAYLAHPGVETLAGIATARPAIVVSAGPSLARCLPTLRTLKDRAVIICVQTAFKPLLEMGIHPHFVTSIDFHDVSAEFFRGVSDVGDCTLVAELKAAAPVLEIYPGPMRIGRHRYADALLGPAGPPRAGLRSATTVAHLSFYLAQHLGCDPILLVGQDLAFSEGLYYMPGAPIEATWSPELNRFQTVESKQWERIVRNRPILRRATDVRGRPIYTDEQLASYAEQFQRDFASAPQTVIQASGAGLALSGAQSMTLEEAAAVYCREPFDRATLTCEGGTSDVDVPRVLAELDQRLQELDGVRRIAIEMRALLERLIGLVERPEEFNRLIGRVDELRIQMTRFERIYGLVIDVSSQAELRRYQADRAMREPAGETAETARRRLARDIDYVTAFIDGCEFLGRILPEAVARVRRRLENS